MTEGKYQEETGIIDAIVQDEPQALATREPSEVTAYTSDDPQQVILSGPYIGASVKPFDDKAQAVLAKYEVVPDEWLDIKPNGQIYLAHMKARKILNEAFGFGGWAPLPASEIRQERIPMRRERHGKVEEFEHVILYRAYRMYVHGAFTGECIATGDYYTNNPEGNYGDAAEACQSYAINRLCKPFGIASQCWDKQYGERWKKMYAVQRDGKWYKKDIQTNQNVKVSGAGQAGGEGAHSSSRGPQEPAPSQPSNVDRAPQKRATGRPASGNEVSEGKATIHVKIVKDRKGSNPETQRASVRDTDDVWWMFHGWENIDRAITSQKSGRALSVTYDIKGEFRNVRSTEWAEES